jgi:uncharacterized protein YceK
MESFYPVQRGNNKEINAIFRIISKEKLIIIFYREERLIMKILILLLSAVLAGCSTMHSTILPQEDGGYIAIATHKKEKTALKTVMTDAYKTCKNEGHNNFYSINQKTEYIGPKLTDGSEEGLSGFAKKVAEAAAKHKNEENYRVEMLFKCRS